MSVKKDLATVEGHLEPINHEAAGISFDPTGTSSSADNVQDALYDALSGTPGSGDVSGPSSSDDKAIARFDGTTGKIIQNSPNTKVQDSGAIQAQGFITRREVDDTVTVPSGYSWIAPSIEMGAGGVIVLEANAELILVG